MHALEVLEFGEILARLARHCETERGRGLAAELRPERVQAEAHRALARTAEAIELLNSGPPALAGVRDLRQPLSLAKRGVSLDGEVLLAAARLLTAVREAHRACSARLEEAPHLARLALRLSPREDLEDRIRGAIGPGGEVLSSASPELARARSEVQSNQARMVERIRRYVSGPARAMLSDPIYTERSGRLVIPLKAEYRGRIKGIVHDSSASGQTIYLEPEDVVEHGNRLREAEAKEKAEILRVLAELSHALGQEAAPLTESLEALADLDLLLAKARLGVEMRGCQPQLADGPYLELTEARHPLLDRAIAVPFSLTLGRDPQAILITGPNTGGKTVTIKAVGLIAAMAQSGMLPPAAEARIGCFTQFWADIGDEQSLEQSLSTFSSHIKNIAEALTKCREGALVLLDEAGAGTDPAEGASLARALFRAFKEKGCRILASTHYGELKSFAANEAGFVNASMEFDEASLRPTYRLLMGVPGASQALAIAERYGIPSEVVEEARQGFTEEEMSLDRAIRELRKVQEEAREARLEAQILRDDLARAEEAARDSAAQSDADRARLRQKASEELREAVRLIRLEAASIFDDLRRAPTPEARAKGRQRLKDLEEVAGSFVEDVRPKAPARQTAAQRPVAKGDAVKVKGIDQAGVILDVLGGGRLQVQVGALKMTAAAKDVRLLEDAAPAAPRQGKPKSQIDRRMRAVHEIHLRRLRFEAAQEELEKFLDDSILAGAASLRIVHGKGGGVLRQMTHKVLKGHPQVSGYRTADPDEGGEGVTIVQLR
jgi:DNA mismatch repair protein MutS2